LLYSKGWATDAAARRKMNFNLAGSSKGPAITQQPTTKRKIHMKIQIKRGYNWEVIPERQRVKGRANALLIALACLLLPLAAFAQFPATAYGWNLGNTLEPDCGEGCWAPPATQALINQVSASGFNTIRIPVNWGAHVNTQNVIDPAWLARVKVVVDWCLAKNMTVIINMHHDPFDWQSFRRFDSKMNARYIKIWQQVAQYFQAYDSRLIFCAANEPGADTQAKTDVLKQYYQNFINMVRGTGGNNANRWLILPGPNTNIDHTYNFFTLPTDPTPGRLAVDVHYYDPFGFCLQTTDASWGNYAFFWGSQVAGYRTSVPSLLYRNTAWGEEDWLAGQIAKMKTKFVNNGVPVVLGEFAAGKRIDYPELGTGVEYTRHLASRTYFDKKVVEVCNANGIKPYFWDNGWDGKDGFNLFNRITAAVMEQPQITALTGGAAQLPPP
jgi:endoglucanase